jgi:hypothetical protein
MSDQGSPPSGENPYASPSGPEYGPPYGPPPDQPIYPQYSPPAYGAPQQPYGYGGPALPDHPSASTAFVLGLVSLVGGFFCWLPIFVGPFAWVVGARAKREIDAHPGVYGGREKANAGMIMGIVATALMALAVLVIVVAIVAIVAAGS